jgi:hypothetical protein
MRPRLSTPLAACAAAVVGAGAWAACATAETPAESHGDCVAAGCLMGTSSSSGVTTSVACTPSTSCAVSWTNDIFAAIVDGTAGCTSMVCHGGGAGGISLTSGAAADAYQTLIGFTLAASPGPAKKYIVPCSPADSGFACNMAVAADAGANPNGKCGVLMPFGAGTSPLTLDQVAKIGAWITCGAPNN